MTTHRFVARVARRYPARTALLGGLLVLSGLAESLGIAALLPLLELATGSRAHARSVVSRTLESLVHHAGLPLRLDVILALISAAMILKGALRLLAMRQVGYAVSHVGTDLRLDFIDSLLRTRWSYFIQQPVGRFANAIGTEAVRASTAYQYVCLLFAATVEIALYTALALLVSWRTALLALAAGAAIVAVRAPLVRRARAASQAQHRLLRSISARLTDVLGGIKPIKAMGREEHLRHVLRLETNALDVAQERQVLAVEAVGATREPLLVVLLSLMLYVALTATTRSFASVLVIGFLFTRLAGRISQAQTYYQEIVIGESAFDAIEQSIAQAASQREPTGGGLAPPPIETGVTLDAVSFGYDGRVILDRVTLDIPAHRLVAIVGPSGSGKTTIADLVIGLQAPWSGAILADGVPVQELDTAAWRRQIGYVPQDAALLHDTVYENVVLGDAGIAASDVALALRAAGAEEFVAGLPEGVDTILGERGARLSGGQRQRIAIARALVRRPRLLILDEVTASLDPTAEAAICETVRALRGSVTILSISHQPLMVEAADVVYRLENGHVRRWSATAAPLADGAWSSVAERRTDDAPPGPAQVGTTTGGAIR